MLRAVVSRRCALLQNVTLRGRLCSTESSSSSAGSSSGGESGGSRGDDAWQRNALNSNSAKYQDNYDKIFGTSNKKTLRTQTARSEEEPTLNQAELPVPSMLSGRKKADLDSFEAQSRRLIKGIKADMDSLSAKVKALEALASGGR